jgi:hypothetical protein
MDQPWRTVRAEFVVGVSETLAVGGSESQDPGLLLGDHSGHLAGALPRLPG